MENQPTGIFVSAFRQKFFRALLVLVLGIHSTLMAQVAIISQPRDALDVPVDSDVTFEVQAQGSGTLRYQWRLNGVNIPGETSTKLILPKIQPTNGGSYSVAVSDRFTSINSAIARLTLQIPTAPSRDLFDNAFFLDASSGIFRSSNRKTTAEPGEPQHNGKPGGGSIWFRWSAPTQGIVVFSTRGSGFDTLLGIYTGQTLSRIIPVSAVGGEDAGGFLTSQFSFNTQQGEIYSIAVDGFAGEEGDVTISWTFFPTPDLLPTIGFTTPDRTVGFGDKLTLAYTSDDGTQGRWFFNGQPTQITGNQFVIDNMTPERVGIYQAQVTDRKGLRTVLTRAIRVQINLRGDGSSDPNSKTYEKFLDAAIAARQTGQAQRPGNDSASAGGGLASGYSSSQIFSTLFSSKDAGEPNHCAEPGGASEWYTFQPTNAGTLQINTDGSSFDAVLAVYTGPGTSYASLVSTVCASTPGLGGDRVQFPGKSGEVYYIAVDGVGGARGTAYLNINFGDPPVIVNPPTNQIVSAGSNATFTVSATGSGPLRYRWMFDGVPILNATNSSYTVTNVQAPSTGNYTVSVSNVVQVVTSTPPAVLSLRAAPVITVQPTNRTVNLTSNTTFTVVATGNPPPTYQWRFGATNLPGATNASFTRTNVQTNDAGIYSVVVSNAAGSAISSNATLTVNVPPVFTLDPLSRTSNVGATVVFTASASGTPPVVYQWRFGGTDLPGETNSSLSLTNVQIANAGNYRVGASNSAGAVLSAIAVLTISAPPVITQQPLTQTVAPGSNPALNVTATGSPTPTYQWRFNSTDLSGETAAVLTLVNFQTNHEGDYSVMVSNSIGSILSSNATLALNAPLRIKSFSLTSTSAQMQMIGIVGSNYVFQAATNLIDWTSLKTNVASNGFQIFVDTNIAHFPTRTYRVQQP